MSDIQEFQCALCSIYFRSVLWIDGKCVCLECVKDCVRFQLGCITNGVGGSCMSLLWLGGR